MKGTIPQTWLVIECESLAEFNGATASAFLKWQERVEAPVKKTHYYAMVLGCPAVFHALAYDQQV